MKFSKTAAEKFANSVDFSKCNGLAAAVVQNSAKDVLMVAFMDKRALLLTLTTGFMHYFSRSRKRLWKKGEQSGNTQQVLSVKKDCDSDALLFTVKQKGVACHTGEKACFGEPDFTLLSLAQLIEERKKNAPAGSYTAKLLRSKSLSISKVREESEELIEAVQEKGKKDITWEAADLLYHTLALAYAAGISIGDINRELARRNKP
ncbi:Phosphoribosyl-AMP cyclohydrolase [Candidatus Anstonella stagnisolia]|nr:Phosphoribosyl-AMP cyclohydrolase [Candidatus Anstonella stagnisolia]